MNIQQHLGFDAREIFETKLSSGCPSDTMVPWKQGQLQCSLKRLKRLTVVCSDCLVCSWICESVPASDGPGVEASAGLDARAVSEN